MTQGDSIEMGVWVSRFLSNILLALLVPAAGWLLLTVQDITVSLAKLEIKQEQLGEKASEVATLVSDATERWRREQAQVDNIQNDKLEAHQDWLGRITARINRVEDFARDYGFTLKETER